MIRTRRGVLGDGPQIAEEMSSYFSSCDLPNVIGNCSVNLYADDTTIYYSSRDAQEVKEVLEAELRAVVCWIEQNHLKMNVSKTQLMVLSRRRRRHEAK